MKILVLGGSGAIGDALLPVLVEEKNIVYATSRKREGLINNVNWIKCDAHLLDFLIPLVYDINFDVVVDFLVYSNEEFSKNISFWLSNVKHYYFISSARVYANSNDIITENSTRIKDSLQSYEWSFINEYAIIKADQEDILKETEFSNWTIIRPYITYNWNRLQLWAYEKEKWLFRVFMGEPIILPDEAMDCFTTMTYAKDVSVNMVQLFQSNSVDREVIQLISNETHSWNEIINIYSSSISKIMGEEITVLRVNDWTFVSDYMWNSNQIRYDRMWNRRFFSKFEDVKDFNYTSLGKGIESCLYDFIKKGYPFGDIDWDWEYLQNLVTGTLCKLERDIVVFGAGKNFINSYSNLIIHHNIVKLVDNNEKLWGNKYADLICESPQELENTNLQVIITVSEPGAIISITRQLKSIGICDVVPLEIWKRKIKNDAYYRLREELH